MTEIRTFDATGLPRRPISVKYDIPFIQRVIFKPLCEAIPVRKEIEVIVGPRQCGKTTLLARLIEFLIQENKVEPNQIIYSNLDWMVDYSFFKNALEFLDRIQATLGKEKKIFLFLDEVQRLTNPGKFLKGLYDANANIKIIVSGSSSLELKAKLKEYLTGRKKETHIYPLSFREKIFHENIIGPNFLKELGNLSIQDFAEKIKHDDKIFGPALKEAFFEMMQHGGYPKVLLSPITNKREELEEIYTSYVKKDVVEFMKIEKPELFNNLIKALAYQTGNLINYSELGSLAGGNQITIKKYGEILAQTFVLHLLPPLLGNRRNEIKQAHKSFFYDSGLRNYITGQLATSAPLLGGGILENTLFSEILKILKKGCGLFFWRTKAGSEVDFVIDTGNKQYIPIEVKSGPATIGRLSKSFHSFIDSYKPRRAVFANKNLVGQIRIKQTDIFYLPFYWIPLVDFLWQPGN